MRDWPDGWSLGRFIALAIGAAVVAGFFLYGLGGPT